MSEQADNNTSPQEPHVQKPWETDEALASLKMERELNPDETEEGLARRLLREAAPQVAMSMIQMAIHGSTEATRTRNSQYILDHVLGKPRQDTANEGNQDPLLDFLNELHDAAEQHANSTSSES